jgi:hypothetical protein
VFYIDLAFRVNNLWQGCSDASLSFFLEGLDHLENLDAPVGEEGNEAGIGGAPVE